MLTSPLRYPGGKAKLFGFFCSLIKENNLLGSHYCEPYAGGAGLALKLLSAGLVETVALNDVDEAVWAFWHTALHENDELVGRIRSATLTIDEWYQQREVWRARNLQDPVSLGFAAFYLNRTNRSGIIEGAGPVGGYAQAGKWRLDARFDRTKQADAVAALAPFRSQISVSRLDALDFVKQSFARHNSLTYLDPPYYVKGSKLYRNSYVHDDHAQVRDLVTAYRDAAWVVSYDSVPPIIDLYASFDPIFYSLNYSAGAVGTGREVIYLSDPLRLGVCDGFERHAA